MEGLRNRARRGTQGRGAVGINTPPTIFWRSRSPSTYPGAGAVQSVGYEPRGCDAGIGIGEQNERRVRGVAIESEGRVVPSRRETQH